MPEGTDQRVVHLVIIDGRQPDAAAAAEDLIRGLRGLLDELARTRCLLNAAFGRPLGSGVGPPADLGLEAFDQFTHVVQLEFASLAHLESYYRAPLHAQLRFDFYRRLPDLGALWAEYDTAPVERREEIFGRIDRRATQLYIRRVDYAVDGMSA